MTPGAKCRLAIAMTALAAYGCSDQAPPTEEAGPAVAHENPHPDHRVPEPADPTLNLDRTLSTAPRASRSNPRPRPAAPVRNSPPAGGAPSSDVRTVTSTAYCLTGTMANGQRVYRGAVAMNGVPFGSVWQVDGGGTYTVADRIGHSSQFDIAMPGDCAAAMAYGRRTITVRRIG